MELLSAKEARDKVRGAREHKLNQEFKRVVEAIHEAVEDNRLEVIIYESISIECENRLKDKGYGVKYVQTGINENGTEISWS